MYPLLQASLARGVWSHDEIVSAAVGVPAGTAMAALAFVLIRRFPWPRPFQLRFLALHFVAAPLGGLTWGLLSIAIRTRLTHEPFVADVSRHVAQFVFVGAFFYLVLFGIAHAIEGSARAARAEAMAARTQLAALRAQLQPHFLFNALHTVVQLAHIEPRRAAEAAELVAELLRTTLEEQRDEVTLGDEWDFVSRYLAVERIRFGDRLVVRAELGDDLLDERVPAFALQTLVENAVHHGAAPRVEATEVIVRATASSSQLTLSVRNDGSSSAAKVGAGTGLARLRERLAVLYGSAAKLVTGPVDGGGYEAMLTVPLSRGAGA